MKTDYRGKNWPTGASEVGQHFEDFDFTDTNFELSSFEGCAFENCTFIDSKIFNMRISGCDFQNCLFDKVVFDAVAIGAGGGVYSQCLFRKCDFSRQSFRRPKFELCNFDHCKFKGTSFNDSTLIDCRFSRILTDVTFNGIYHDLPVNRNALVRVDFSEAKFKEFVSFYDCDLSSCTPPKGHNFEDLLYQFFRNDPTVLSTGSKDRIVVDRRP